MQIKRQQKTYFFSSNLQMTEKQAKEQGERLRQIRKKMKVSQIEFAELLQSAQPYVSKIEVGKVPISVELLVRLLNHIPYVNINWYLTGEGDMFLSGRAPGAAGMASEPAVGYGASVEDRLAAVEAFIAWKFADFPGSKKYS